MQSDRELAADITRRVGLGTLPREHRARIYAGHGDARSQCDICKRPIGRDEILYEVVFAAEPTSRPLLMHLRCHDLWRRAAGESG